MCKHAIKKLVYLLGYVSDQCKTQEMCYKPILENAAILKNVSVCLLTHEMCKKSCWKLPSCTTILSCML